MSYVFKSKEPLIIDSIPKELTLDSIKSYDKKYKQFNDEIILHDYAHLFINQFQENFLREYELINSNEIRNFIFKNDDLIELFHEINFLIKKYFNDYPCSLEFVQDPEFNSLNQLVIYVHGEESSFDEDWGILKQLNKEIRMLNISNKDVKSLVSVDLW